MLQGLVPAGVVVAATRIDRGPGDLFPAEEAMIARAGPRRRAEFTTTRGCARRALGALGVGPRPILRGERGAPLWPPGVVGSLTHCAGYRAAAVAWAHTVAGVGIDVDRAAPFPDGAADLVALPAEQQRLDDLAPSGPSLRVLFSAKESFFKAWWPLTGVELDLLDAQVWLERDGGLAVRLARPTGVLGGELGEVRGRWRIAGGFVATAVAIGADVRSSP